MNRKSFWSPSEHGGGVARAGLEGSRFGTYLAALATFVSSLVRPKRMKAGGSRERPIGSQRYGPSVNQSEDMVSASRWGYSREPLVATFFGPMERWNKYREVALLHTKAALLQAVGRKHALLTRPTISRTRTTTWTSMHPS
jgi:hypothetical protein